MRYNTEDENLSLWKCHPEKICVNCLHMDKSPYVMDSPRSITLYCTAGRWTLSKADCAVSYIDCLLAARVCKAYKYIDSFIKVAH